MLLLCIILIFKYYKYEAYAQPNIISRDMVGEATCIKDDIPLSNSYFKCQMNKKYSPININVLVVKYQNFAPNLTNSTPSVSFDLMNTLTPSLTPVPLFSDSDFNLIGTTTNLNTGDKTLNDYKKIMKVLIYPSANLFDDPSVIGEPTLKTSSLEDNNFLNLSDSIVPYFKYLNDLNMLQPFIDINKIDAIDKIASQFNLYLNGLLIPYTKPDGDLFRLEREIVVTTSSDMKNIVGVEFNQTITDQNQVKTSSTTSLIVNYSKLIINSYVDYMLSNSKNTNFITPILNTINMYSSYLKSRQLIDQYDIDALIDIITNIDNNNILYVNYYFYDNLDTPDFGIQLVKRINGKMIFMNYFDNTFIYYKNMCPDPKNNYFYKGRCYSNCPVGYSSLGLACIRDDEKTTNQINNIFSPESDFCTQVCNASDQNVSNFDSNLQKACWCKSLMCDKCNDFTINNCNC